MRKFKLAKIVSLVMSLMFVSGLIFGTLLTPAPSHQITQPNVIVEVFDHSLDPFVPMWQKEVGRRFTNAVVVLCHGGDFLRGEWIVGSQPGSGHVETVDAVLMRVQKQYPGRQVVLLACNTGHLTPKTKDVYYAMSSVWCVPDRGINGPDAIGSRRLTLDGQLENRWDGDSDVVGNIWEFVKS